MNLRTKKDLHLERKVFHLFGVSTLFVFLHLCPRPINLVLLGIGFVVSLAVDLMRLKSPAFNKRVLEGWVKHLARAEEQDSLSSGTHMVIGVGLCYLLFNNNITALSLMFLGLGDPTASICGVLYGKTKLIGSKSLEGSLASWAICALAYWAYSLFNPAIPNGLLMALIAGALGAIAELIPLGSLDDNLSQPILSGALLSALFYFIG